MKKLIQIPCLLLLWLSLTSKSFAYEPTTIIREPDPFRRDSGQLDGRDFEFSTAGFLSRFSYQFRPEWNEQWLDNPEGYRITAGSVRSRDLYVVHFLNKTLELSDLFIGHIRHRRDEDFDSRYDRTLVGVGITPTKGWSASLLSDIVATKEEIDLQFELAWNGRPGNRFRLAVVAVDHFFNDKQESAEYETKPFTFFAEAHVKLQSMLRVGGSINWNPELILLLEEETREYRYENLVAEGYLLLPLTSATQLSFSAKAEAGDVRNELFEPTAEGSYQLSRGNLTFDLVARQRLSPIVSVWLGGRYFYLDERTDQLNNESRADVERTEPVLHSGVQWQLAERWLFWPGIYIAHIDVLDPQREEGSERERGFHGRITLPLEYAFSDSARATFNPTLRAPDGPFGGLNVQFQVFF